MGKLAITCNIDPLIGLISITVVKDSTASSEGEYLTSANDIISDN